MIPSGPRAPPLFVVAAPLLSGVHNGRVVPSLVPVADHQSLVSPSVPPPTVAVFLFLFAGVLVLEPQGHGVRDFAENEVTALLSPPKDPEALARNIVRLLENDDLRIRLAKAGHERIKEFTWENSTDLLEQFLKGVIGQPDLQKK